jgi:hypothetical protein
MSGHMKGLDLELAGSDVSPFDANAIFRLTLQ